MLKVCCVLASKEVPGLSFVVSHQGTFGSLKPLVERRIFDVSNKETGGGCLMTDEGFLVVDAFQACLEGGEFDEQDPLGLLPMAADGYASLYARLRPPHLVQSSPSAAAYAGLLQRRGCLGPATEPAAQLPNPPSPGCGAAAVQSESWDDLVNKRGWFWLPAFFDELQTQHIQRAQQGGISEWQLRRLQQEKRQRVAEEAKGAGGGLESLDLMLADAPPTQQAVSRMGGFSAGASTRPKSHGGSRPCGRCFYDCCSSACPYCTWVEWVKDDGCFFCSLKTLVEIFLGCCCLFDCSAPCSGAPPTDAVKVWVMNRNSYW